MTRITFAIATVLSLAFTSLAAQEANCDGWMSSDKDVVGNFWKTITVERVSDCLTSGAKINARGKDGVTPLHLAAGLNNNPDIVTVLLDAGAKLNARNKDGLTSLHVAARYNNNPDVVTLLLVSGADSSAVNDAGDTPFELAKMNKALAGTEIYWVLNDLRFE